MYNRIVGLLAVGLLVGGVLVVVLAACAGKGEIFRFDPQDRIDAAVVKSVETLSTPWAADSLPRNILQGQSGWNRVGIHDWTSGFWPGVLWYAYEASGRADLLEYARKYTEPLRGVLSVPVDNHDLGFMFFCSYGNGYRLTGDEHYRKLLLTAADSLATLFNPKVGSILSWPAMRTKMNWPHNTIIDNMMNLELLFWASKNGGGAHLADIAVKHAETSMRTLVRPDYSTFHVAVFDTTDGRFLKGVTHQGYADSSFWARGQAWGIYGFTMSFRESGKMAFLETAQKLADRFL
ncbi:MAG: glycoside hydrolase family 88 protein, partial [Bacteroidales bacterium]